MPAGWDRCRARCSAPEQIRKELQAITAATSKPYNVNFFVHKQPTPDPAREDAWRKVLAPYFAEYGIDPDAIQAGPQRAAVR